MENKSERKRIGIQFREQREQAGWTIEQVATMADVKIATIEKIEAGAFNVPLDIINKYAEVLGCEVRITIKSL